RGGGGSTVSVVGAGPVIGGRIVTRDAPVGATGLRRVGRRRTIIDGIGHVVAVGVGGWFGRERDGDRAPARLGRNHQDAVAHARSREQAPHVHAQRAGRAS